ncbi:MAG: tyrosine-type recombinase/integrase [Armatimonadota bacterium]
MRGCRPMTDDEISEVSRSFWGEHARRDKALFLLGVKSGFRISELLSLRLKDVLQAGRIVDRVSVERRNMKKKTEGRTVLLHPEAKSALAEWLQELHDWGYLAADAYVFQSRKGHNRSISRIQAYRILKETFDACEMTGKLGTHSMRKSFANKIYDKLGGDLIKTQRALGHRNINSTVQYLSFREEEIDEAILAL